MPSPTASPALARHFATWFRLVQRNARPLAAGISVLVVLLGLYAAQNLGVNSDVNRMIDPDVEFRQREVAFRALFPSDVEAILVVVESDEPARTREAAEALAEALRARTDQFRSVSLPWGGPFFERHGLLYSSEDELERLADRLAAAQPVFQASLGADAVAGVSSVLSRALAAERDGTSPGYPLAEALDRFAGVFEAALRGEDPPDPWAGDGLAAELEGEATVRVVSLEPVLEFGELLAAEAAIETIRETTRRLGLSDQPGLRIRLTGDPVLNYEEMLALRFQGVAVGVGSLLLVAVALFAALRSAAVALAMVVNLLACLITTAAFAAAAIGDLNQLSVCFSVLVIGLGVDFGIHLCMRYGHEMRRQSTPRRALVETGRGVGPALLVCAITTAVGFLVFVPTDFRGVAELGLITAFGILASFALSVTYLPALLALRASAPMPARRAGPSRWVRTLRSVPTRFPRTVCTAAALLALASLPLLGQLRFNNNAVDLRDPNTESVQAFDDLLAYGDTSPWTADVVAPDLARARAIAARVARLDAVGEVRTIADYVPDGQPEKIEILETIGYLLPLAPGRAAPDAAATERALRALRAELREAAADRDPALASAASRLLASLDDVLLRFGSARARAPLEQTLRAGLQGSLPDRLDRLRGALEPDLVTLDTLPDSIRASLMAPDGRVRVQIAPRDDLSDPRRLDTFVSDVESVVPEATGAAVVMVEWGRLAVASMSQAVLAAVVCMTLVLWAVWRRLGDVVLAFLPLGLAAIFTSAVMVLGGLELNFANVTVVPMLMGIGVDSGIHLIARRREAPDDGDLLASTASRAVVFSALTTLAGFVNLAFAPHRGMAALGQMLTIGLVAMLLCTLVVLPAVLAWHRQPRRAPRPRPETTRFADAR